MNILISPSQQNGVEETLVRPICELLVDKLQDDALVNADIIPDMPGATDNARLIAAINWSNQWFETHGGANSGYHLSIHSDGGYNGSGVSAFYYGEKGKAFVKPIYEAMCAITPWADMALRLRTDLGELKQTIASAALIELSFHDQPAQYQWMKNNADLITETIKNAIYKSLNILPAIDYKKRCTVLELQNAQIAGQLQEIMNKLRGVNV